ncbi:hypothetical protein [Tropicimonas sp. S265A]|uniref:hypothetical protein n=1 Tax=Tropicimonas sp. S265A TaxID=3415134 RepID=UPI003C7C0FA2
MQVIEDLKAAADACLDEEALTELAVTLAVEAANHEQLHRALFGAVAALISAPEYTDEESSKMLDGISTAVSKWRAIEAAGGTA